MKLLFTSDTELPFNIPLFALYLAVNCSMGANIAVFLAPMLVRPLHTEFLAVWHQCCGLAEDFKAFFKWTGEHLHEK
jgi:hypothetical protein